MRFETFHFEVKDLVTQFCNAFDSVVIKRYDSNRNVVSKINVRYVYAPKQRVLYDLVNKAQNIDVPCIAISVNGISRDESRVFNKLSGFYSNNVSTSYYYKTPIPVNIDISMSVICKYQTDLDQILSNFIPYTNPYIIISWKVPEEIQLVNLQEIRSEVMWSGNISLGYPTELSETAKYRITADTSFTIKGWMFKNDNNPVGNIYTINSNFYPVSAIDVTLENDITSYNAKLSGDKETVTVTALPPVSSTYSTFLYDNNPVESTTITLGNLPKIILSGSFLSELPQMEYAKQVFLSANTPNLLPKLSAIDFYSGTSVSNGNPPFSAYEINTNGGEVVYGGRNIFITLPPITAVTDYSIIVSNESGYKTYIQGVIQ